VNNPTLELLRSAPIDLRHTPCLAQKSLFPKSFGLCSDRTLSALSSPTSILDYLNSSSLFPQLSPYVIYISSLHHPRPKPSWAACQSVAPQDAFVVLSPSSGRVKVSNAGLLDEGKRTHKSELRREVKTQAKYDRIMQLAEQGVSWNGGAGFMREDNVLFLGNESAAELGNDIHDSERDYESSSDDAAKRPHTPLNSASARLSIQSSDTQDRILPTDVSALESSQEPLSNRLGSDEQLTAAHRFLTSKDAPLSVLGSISLHVHRTSPYVHSELPIAQTSRPLREAADSSVPDLTADSQTASQSSTGFDRTLSAVDISNPPEIHAHSERSDRERSRPLSSSLPPSSFYVNTSQRHLRPSLHTASSLPSWSGATTDGVLLYRPPPPYSTLESIRAQFIAKSGSLSKRKAVEDEIQNVDRRAREKDVMGVWGKISKRRRTQDNPTSNTAMEAAFIPSSKNPFRRKETLVTTSVFTAEERAQDESRVHEREPPIPVPAFAGVRHPPTKDQPRPREKEPPMHASVFAIEDDVEDPDGVSWDAVHAATQRPRAEDSQDTLIQDSSGDKQLRPISTLSIPSLPPFFTTPPSSANPEAPTTASEQQMMSQAKLEFKDNFIRSDRPKGLRPSSSVGSLNSAKVKSMKQTGAMSIMKPRASSTAIGFDWKGWANK
jgi:hypothetical protein